MKKLDFETFLSADQLFTLIDHWLVLDIAANELPKDDQNEPFVYAQQVSCKLGGQINLLTEYSLANLYFAVPPVIKLEDVEFVAKKLVVGQDKKSSDYFAYVFGYTVEDEEELDFQAFCSTIFLLNEKEGDRT
jgi:hypothetical protein